MITSHSSILRMRNVSDKCCRENQQTHFLCPIFYFFEMVLFFEITWENMAEPDRMQVTIWRMRIACLISKATDTQNI